MKYLLSFRAYACYLASCLLLASCGFALRGTDVHLPARFSNIYMQTSRPITAFAEDVKEQLRLNGANLTTQVLASVILEVGDVSTYSRQIAITGDSALREYERIYSAHVRVIEQATGQLLGERTVSTVRYIQEDERRLLASDEQANMIQTTAERVLAQRIIQYLKTL